MALKIDGESIQKGLSVPASLWGGTRKLQNDFKWICEVWVGRCHGRAMALRGLSDSLNLKIKPNTTRARPLGLGKHRHKVLGLGRARPMGLGLVFGV